jgi:glutaminase
VEPSAGRRATDIDAHVELRLQEVVGDTRHAMREDLQILGQTVATAQILATKEHGEVSAKLDHLAAIVAPLPDKVAALERSEAVDAARQQATNELLDAVRGQRRDSRNFMVTVVVAAAGVCGAIAAFVPH